MAYFTTNPRAAPAGRSAVSLGAEKFVTLEIIKDAFHAASGVVRRDFVFRRDIVGDFVDRLPLFKPFPNDHRSFIQLKILFGIQIDQDPLAAIEIGNDNVFAGYEIS